MAGLVQITVANLDTEKPLTLQLVIFLIEHGPEGSAGVILNRPSMLVVRDFLDQMPNSKVGLLSHAAANLVFRHLVAFAHPVKIPSNSTVCASLTVYGLGPLQLYH